MVRKLLLTALAGGCLGLSTMPAIAQDTQEPSPTATPAPELSELKTFEGREIPEFNQEVLSILSAYPTNGRHDYYWPRGNDNAYDGGTKDMYLDGVRVMKGDEKQRTFCCGLTLEVFLKTYKRWEDEHGVAEGAKLTPEKWDDFKATWFVKEINGPGPSAALEKYGLGKEIQRAKVLPGDFVQIWRRHPADKDNGSGHSVIFLDWVRNGDGDIKGFEYWSTQSSTEGIHRNTEYFAPPEAEEGVADEYTYWARVEIPEPTGQPEEEMKEEVAEEDDSPELPKTKDGRSLQPLPPG